MKNKILKVLTVLSCVCALVPINSVATKNDWDTEWKGGNCADLHKNNYCTYVESKYGGYNGINGIKKPCCVRDKGDTTSIYVYNKSGINAEVHVTGENDLRDYYHWSVIRKPGLKDIPTSTWTVPARTERFIPQYVKELGYKYAHVDFPTYRTYGLWSADSSGWYPDATIEKHTG